MEIRVIPVALRNALLCLMVSILCAGVAQATVLDNFSSSGAWSIQAFGGGELMWADMPNSWNYIDPPGSYRIWLTTTGGDSQRSGVMCNRECPVRDLTPYNKISFYIRGEGTYTGQPVDLRISLYLYDDDNNAWLCTNDSLVTYSWSKYTFNRGAAAVGPSGDFIDASNGANFHWNNVKTIRLVVQEPSTGYPSSIDAHVYVDILEATGNAVPTPLIDDFNSTTGAWIATVAAGARCLAVDKANNWHSTEGGKSMRVWLTCDASDGQRGTVTLEKTGEWNLALFDKIGLDAMSWSMERDRPSNLKIKLVMGNASLNAWVQTGEVILPNDQLKRLEFKRTTDFTDAGGGSAFSWNDITNIRLVLLESSASNSTPVDAEVYFDLLNATAAPGPRSSVLYDTGHPVEMLYQGSPRLIGFSSGNMGSGAEECRTVVPFSVKQACVINEVWANWFASFEDLRNLIGKGSGTWVKYTIWSRSGSAAPGTIISSGVLGRYDLPRDEDSRVAGNINVYKYPNLSIPLAAGEYYLSIYATRDDGAPVYLNWYTGGSLQDERLEWSAAYGQTGFWRALNLAETGFIAFKSTNIAVPLGVDSDDAYNPCVTLLGTLTEVSVSGIGSLKVLADGTLARINQPVICSTSSRTFADSSFYVEDIDRASGIRVVPSAGLAVSVSEGDQVAPTGFLRTNDQGERYLEAISL